MSKLKIILLTLFLPSILSAQIIINSDSLHGRVLANMTNYPASFSYLSIEGTSIGAVSDSLGDFTFRNLPSGKFRLRISNIGYSTLDTAIFISKNGKYNFVFRLFAKCSFNEQRAESDIANKNVKLLIVGSIAPRANSEKDNKFEKKYDITYYDIGDTPPANVCIEEYNKIVFKYLDNKYGKAWRKEVRKDVFSLSK